MVRLASATCITMALLFHVVPLRAQPSDDVESLAIYGGTCERMSAAGEDLGGACRGPLMNTSFASGRTSFAFPTDAGLMVSFSGTARREQGGRTQLRLDRITVAVSNRDEAVTEAATGICEYEDLRADQAELRCAGRSETGAEFVALFRTDGRPPRVERF